MYGCVSQNDNNVSTELKLNVISVDILSAGFFPFIAAPRTKVLTHRNAAHTGTPRDSCSAKNSYKRNAVYIPGPNKEMVLI